MHWEFFFIRSISFNFYLMWNFREWVGSWDFELKVVKKLRPFTNPIVHVIFLGNVRVAKLFVPLISDYKVTGSNPTGDGIQLMIVWYWIAQNLSLSPFHYLYMNLCSNRHKTPNNHYHHHNVFYGDYSNLHDTPDNQVFSFRSLFESTWCKSTDQLTFLCVRWENTVNPHYYVSICSERCCH